MAAPAKPPRYSSTGHCPYLAGSKGREPCSKRMNPETYDFYGWMKFLRSEEGKERVTKF